MQNPGPNVLLVIADQLTPRVLGAEGGPVPTPAIDSLYESGASFRHAITPFPVCSPARASIVTGLYPHAHGIVRNVMSQDFPAVASHQDDRGITAQDQTTESLLHANGYQTFHAGRWHLTDQPLPYYTNWYREMQEYAGEMRGTFDEATLHEHVLDWYGWKLPVEVPATVSERFPAEFADSPSAGMPGTGIGNKRFARFDEFIAGMGRLMWPEEMTFDYRATSVAIRHIEQAVADGAPFMVTCSMNNPHDSNIVSDPYYGMFDPERIELPVSYPVTEARNHRSLSWYLASRLGEVGVREFLRIYYAQTAMMDRQVQRLLTTLQRCGVEENTIVIFMADHGDMAGGHGMIWKGTDAFYEELVRVPLVIRWPGQLTAHRDNRCVSLVDIMPTLLEATGVKPIAPVHGQSLLTSDTASWPGFSVTQRFHGHDSRSRRVTDADRMSVMLRTPTRKFVRYDDGGEELFNLEADPHEMENLAAHQGALSDRQSMLHQLIEWMRTTSHPHLEAYERLGNGTGPAADSGSDDLRESW